VSEQLPAPSTALRSQVADLRAELSEARAGKESRCRLSALIKGLPGGVLVLDSTATSKMQPGGRDCWGAAAAQSFAAVLARAATGAGGGTGEHLELHSGRFANLSRRGIAQRRRKWCCWPMYRSHLMQVLFDAPARLLTLGELAAGLAHQIRTPLAAACCTPRR